MQLVPRTMRTICLRIFVIAFLALGISVGAVELVAAEGCSQLLAQMEDVGPGELTLYTGMTANGMVARREYKDSRSRIAKTVYYRSKDWQDVTSTVSEEDLVVSEIALHGYNDLDQEVRTEHYSPDMKLWRVEERSYAPDGKISRRLSLDHKCVRTYEQRWFGVLNFSHLYYDDTGENLVGFRGSIPKDIDLQDGWGEPSGGLSCGAAPTKRRALLQGMYINLTVRNLGKSYADLPRLMYPDAQLEVRSHNGQLIPQDRRRIEQLKQGRARTPEPSRPTTTRLDPGQAEHGHYLLKDWYPNLSPGKYLVTCRRPVPGPGKQLVSNTTEIEIIEEKPSVSR